MRLGATKRCFIVKNACRKHYCEDKSIQNHREWTICAVKPTIPRRGDRPVARNLNGLYVRATEDGRPYGCLVIKTTRVVHSSPLKTLANCCILFVVSRPLLKLILIQNHGLLSVKTRPAVARSFPGTPCFEMESV